MALDRVSSVLFVIRCPIKIIVVVFFKLGVASNTCTSILKRHCTRLNLVREVKEDCSWRVSGDDLSFQVRLRYHSLPSFTQPCNLDIFKPHSEIVSFTGVYITFLYSFKHRQWIPIRTSAMRR